MKVTDIAPLDSRRRKVFIDGDYAFPLYLSELRKYHIEPDTELTEQTAEEIEDIIVRRIKERILYLLGDMDRSESDIRQKLTGNGYTSTYIDSAIEQVKAYGYIDDRRYAISYAKSLIDGRHAGPALIRQKLYAKGISRDIIDSIETELQFDESEQIEAALLRKNFTKEDVVNSDYDTRRKLYGYLMRKGFSSSAISNFIHN